MGPVTDEHKLTYKENAELAVQQTDSKFEQGFTYQDGLKGRQMQIMTIVDETTAIINPPRGGDTPNIDNQTEPVWCKPDHIVWGKVIEKEDAIKALTDFHSPFVQSGAKAIVRGRDAEFANSLFRNRIIGQDGATMAPYDPTGRVVDAGIGSVDDVTPTGMNVTKLIRARRLLQAAEVDIDFEELWCVTDAKGMEDLYRDLTYINKDYRDQAVLEKKQVRSILDIRITVYNKMPDENVTTAAGAVWAKSGMHYGDFAPLEVRAEPNPAKMYRLHPFMENWFGATRSDDKKVIKVLNVK